MARVGRPPIIKTPAEFEKKAREYFEQQVEDGNVLTVAGLAYHMGFESRQSFYAYGKRSEYSYVVKRARLLIEAQHEAAMMGTAVAGSIFWLKNHDWSDKQEIAHTGRDGGPIETKEVTELQERAKVLTNRIAEYLPTTNGKQ